MSDPRDFTDDMREATVDGLPKLYVDGVRLFNERDFFECHELLEEMWRHASGDDARFYQGLIQAAVCFYHWGNGNFDGAARLALAAREKLAGLPSVMHRLELGQFRVEFERLSEALLREDASELAPMDARDCPTLILRDSN